MNYLQFRNTIKDKKITIFSKDEIAPLFALKEEGLTSLLRRYTEKKYLQNPKRGVYYFTEDPPHQYYLAYKMYNPSYISFETALSEYGIIPEIVYSITSATTKPTRDFSTQRLGFVYTKIKDSAFTGFTKKNNYLIATPEKALVDYMYHVSIGKKAPNDRLNISQLRKDIILKYTALFNHTLLNKRIWQLLKSLKNEQ